MDYGCDGKALCCGTGGIIDTNAVLVSYRVHRVQKRATSKATAGRGKIAAFFLHVPGDRPASPPTSYFSVPYFWRFFRSGSTYLGLRALPSPPRIIDVLLRTRTPRQSMISANPDPTTKTREMRNACTCACQSPLIAPTWYKT
jgi:hypothetical protein